MKLIIAWTAGIYSIVDVNAIPYLADSFLSSLKLSLSGKGFSAAKGCDRVSEKEDYGASHWSSDKAWKLRKETPTGDHPELEPAIDKIITFLKNEGLTRGQMHFVLAKVQNRLVYSK